jgi:hypothetical protein
MTIDEAGPVAQPRTSASRRTSSVAASAGPSGKARGLCEEGNERHRVRVEHDKHTLLIHVSDEGRGLDHDRDRPVGEGMGGRPARPPERRG